LTGGKYAPVTELAGGRLPPCRLRNDGVNRPAVIHRAIAISLVFAVPLAVYSVNGVVEAWAFLLGAVTGFCYWYFLDPLP
jgi:hypothetical protein